MCVQHSEPWLPRCQLRKLEPTAQDKPPGLCHRTQRTCCVNFTSLYLQYCQFNTGEVSDGCRINSLCIRVSYRLLLCGSLCYRTGLQAHRPIPVIQANLASVRRRHSAPSKQVSLYHYWPRPWLAILRGTLGPTPHSLYLRVWGPHCASVSLLIPAGGSSLVRDSVHLHPNPSCRRF